MSNTGFLRGRLPGGRIVKDISGLGSTVVLTPAEVMAEIITFTGTITVNVTVRLPLGSEDTGHSWVIDNQTTPATFLTVTVGGATGAGVTVPKGRKLRLGWNGATMFTADDGHLSHEAANILVTDTSDVTLSSTQYKCGHIHILGSPGGAFNVLVPASPGLYFVNNGSDQACVMKSTLLLAGISIAAARAAAVACNSAGVVVRMTADVDPALGAVA